MGKGLRDKQLLQMGVCCWALHGWVQITAFTGPRWKPPNLEISSPNSLQLVVVKIQHCLPWKCWESLFSIFLGSRVETWAHRALSHAGLHKCPLGHLSSAQTLCPLEKHTHLHHVPVTASAPRGVCNHQHQDTSLLVLPACLPPTLDKELPEGLDLPSVILGCPIQPSTWHTRDTLHSECFLNEWTLKYPVCSQVREWNTLSYKTGSYLKAETGSMQSQFLAPRSVPR